jgi:single-stranded-DNA-specific exonuclease
MSYAKLLPGMEHFVNRVTQAIEKKERVCIFGDYDCDGITSTVQMVRFFRRYGIEPRTRLPHRLHEGYGLKMSHIEELVRDRIDLLITVDTGISCVNEVAAARAAGIDVLIADHHHVGESMPDAVAILHPLLAPVFPLPHPSAAGVTRLAVLALESSLRGLLPDDDATDSALAAIGTIADLVPLSGVNRLLAEEGVRACQSLTLGPLALLLQQAGLDASCTSRDIAFRIAPRLNAAGRMADPSIALHALLGDPKAVNELDILNRDRQQIVQNHMKQLLPVIEANITPMIFACNAEYSPGIVGLLAGKLTETFGRPSFVGAIKNGVCTASLRSIPGYNVTEALTRCADLLLHSGGHAQAAGCHLDASNLLELEARMNQDVRDRVLEEELVPTLSLDSELQPHSITMRLLDDLDKLEPFGQGNPEPRFLLTKTVLTDVRRVGGDGNHLQARIHGHKVIGFGLGHLADYTTAPLDVACRIGRETFRGQTFLQLYIDDLRLPASNAHASAMHSTYVDAAAL